MAGASEPVDVSTKQQRIAELADKARRWDSRPWLTSSTSTGCARRIGAPARTGRWAWTDRRRGLRGGPGGQPPVAAGPSQVRHVPGAAGAAGPYPEGRLGDRDPAAGNSDLRGQGASAGGRHGAGSRSTSRTSWTARTASGPGRSAHQALEASGSRRWRWEAAGSWRSTSGSSSTRSTTAICGSFSSVGCETGCCCD